MKTLFQPLSKTKTVKKSLRFNFSIIYVRPVNTISTLLETEYAIIANMYVLGTMLDYNYYS